MSDKKECADNLAEVIESFRLGREGQGSVAFTKVIAYLMPRLEQHMAELTQADVSLLNEMSAAQERGDFLFVADMLEYLLPTSTLGKLFDAQYSD